MQIKFWGTRGSIAKPGPKTARYGGNTSCIEVRSARGTLVVIDCGTGLHALGQNLVSRGPTGLRGNILISHTHWDHIQGIPFFDPLFQGGNEWDIYGPKGLRESLREALAGQMQYTYFPVTLDQCAAKVRYHDLVEGTFAIDDIEVSARYLNHPALTLGYRLQADGATMVYACDHEPHSRMLAVGEGNITGQDLRHAEFIEGADLLIHDAQYTAEEYPEKIGWGHSPVEYVMKLAQYARVKSVALTHHDPLRDDDSLDGLISSVRQNSSSVDVFAASEGQIVEVAASSRKRPARPCGKSRSDPTSSRFQISRTRIEPRGSLTGVAQAEMPIEPVLARGAVLLGVADARTSAALSEALQAESIRAQSFLDIDQALKVIAKERPCLAIIEHDLPRLNGISMCRAIRRQYEEDRLPVIMVAGQEDHDAGAAAGVTDWLIHPFTAAYARTKICAWLLRTARHWSKGTVSADKERRLTSPSSMRLLAVAKDIGSDGITSREPVPQKGTEEGYSLEPGVSLDKSALLWMYGREVASFDTPAFRRKVGEIIGRATSASQRLPA